MAEMNASFISARLPEARQIMLNLSTEPPSTEQCAVAGSAIGAAALMPAMPPNELPRKLAALYAFLRRRRAAILDRATRHSCSEGMADVYLAVHEINPSKPVSSAADLEEVALEQLAAVKASVAISDALSGAISSAANAPVSGQRRASQLEAGADAAVQRRGSRALTTACGGSAPSRLGRANSKEAPLEGTAASDPQKTTFVSNQI